MNRRTFLGSAIAAGAAGSTEKFGVLHGLATAGSKREILQVRGLDIVEGGRPLRLRGVNLGGWMLIEDYMIGLPWTEWKIREQSARLLGAEAYPAFFNAYDEAYIADADISFLAQQGFNVVRLPFNYRHLKMTWPRESGLKVASANLIAS